MKAPSKTGKTGARRARVLGTRESRKETLMRDLVIKYLSKGGSRRGFVTGLTKAGLTMTAAQSVLASVSTVTYGQGGPQPAPPAAATGGAARAGAAANIPVKSFEGPGGAAFAEQLIASGVKY